MSQYEVVVLANSIKNNQHCVAGKLVSNGQWVRPVSNELGGELSDAQARIQNPHGTFKVKPLQKVMIGLATHAPLINQPENYVVDGSTWRQNYRVAANDLVNYIDKPSDIWGMSDRVDYAKIQSGEINVGQSLFLLSVTNLRLFMSNNSKRRASFTYNNHQYEFAATDPNFDGLINNQTELENIICVSLAEPLELYSGETFCFKIVASIF